MPSYKLYYFNARGRAEPLRWVLAQAGVEYDDIRLAGEDWTRKKPECPFLQMPILEVTDDSGKTTVLGQSMSILRYLAREFGLAGKTTLDIARGDMIGEQLHDAMVKLPWRESDPEKKKQLTKEAIEGPISKDFELIEKFVQDNGYFVGDGITEVDLTFSMSCEWLTGVCPDALDKFPKLKALNEMVRALPNIAAWIAKRPDTNT